MLAVALWNIAVEVASGAHKNAANKRSHRMRMRCTLDIATEMPENHTCIAYATMDPIFRCHYPLALRHCPPHRTRRRAPTRATVSGTETVVFPHTGTEVPRLGTSIRVTC